MSDVLPEKRRFHPAVVYVIFVLLNVVLMVVGAAIFVFTGFGSGSVVWKTWFWVVAFPTCLATELQSPLAAALFWTNPFIYGGVCWLAWRVSRCL